MSPWLPSPGAIPSGFEQTEGTALIDRDGLVVHHDEAFARLLSQAAPARESWVGISLAGIISLEESTGVLAGEESTLRYRISRAGQECRFVHLGADGQDVHDSLRQSLQAFRHLVDSSPVAIVVLDKDKDVVLWSKAAEAIFGWSAEEILHRPYPLVPPEGWDEFCRLFDHVMAGEGYPLLERVRTTKDGTDVTLQMTTTPIVDSKGEVMAALALLSDVSQQRLLEQRLADKVRLEAIGQLAGGVAHDFNNLLTVVSAHCGFIRQRAELREEDLESLRVIASCTQQAAELTDQLLTFGRKQIVRPTLVDLNRVTQDTTKMIAKLLGPSIRVELSLADRLPPCRIDATQLGQLLVNLMTNARDAMPGGGKIEISTQLAVNGSAEFVLLRVKDFGMGIPKDKIGRIFDPFFTTKAAGKGTGLGLATCFGIAQQAGGSLQAHSEVGVGTEFRLSLPVATMEALDSVQTEIATDYSERYRILLVDDDDLVRMALSALLRDAGHMVTDASGAADALCFLEEDTFDVLLTDVQMPSVSGGRFAEMAQKRHPRLPVLFMSGNLSSDSLPAKVAAGNASVIQKPMNLDDSEHALATVVSGQVHLEKGRRYAQLTEHSRHEEHRAKRGRE